MKKQHNHDDTKDELYMPPDNEYEDPERWGSKGKEYFENIEPEMEEPGIDDSELNGPKVIGKKTGVEIRCNVCKKTVKTKIWSHP